MSYSTKHIIQQPRPYRTLLIIIIVASLTAVIQWYIYRDNSNEQQQLISKLEQQVDQLLEQNARLQKVANLAPIKKSDLAIEKATNEQLQLQLDELQQQLLTQTKDLLFYQSITQGNNSSKLQFRELYLSADSNEADTIRYRLVITQGKKITTPITGDINLVVNVESDGSIVQHKLGTHKLNLRHVQVIEGEIKLENNVQPKTISVELIQKNKVTLSKTFEWKLNN